MFIHVVIDRERSVDRYICISSRYTYRHVYIDVDVHSDTDVYTLKSRYIHS